MDISDWRKKIDELDRKLAALLNERAAAAVEIGRLKRNTSLPIYEPEREREVMVRVAMANEGPLPQDALLALYRQLMETIKRLEELEKSGSRPA